MFRTVSAKLTARGLRCVLFWIVIGILKNLTTGFHAACANDLFSKQEFGLKSDGPWTYHFALKWLLTFWVLNGENVWLATFTRSGASGNFTVVF